MIRLLQLLLLLILAVIAWRLLRQWLAPPADAPPRFEPTGRCTRCGTYVPTTELDAQGVCPRCREGA